MDIEEIVRKHLQRNGVLFVGKIGRIVQSALTELSESHAIEMRAYEATVQNQAERIRQLDSALNGLVSIAHDSEGVAGYHLNGDIADWYSFPEFEDAVAALAAEPKKEGE